MNTIYNVKSWRRMFFNGTNIVSQLSILKLVEKVIERKKVD